MSEPATAPGHEPHDSEADEAARLNVVVLGSAPGAAGALWQAVFGVPAGPGAGRTVDGPAGVGGRVRRHDHMLGLVSVYDATSAQPLPGALDTVVELVAASAQQPLSEQLHLAWFVVSGPFTQDDADAVRRLAEVLPVLAVVPDASADLAGRPGQSEVRLARSIEALQLPLAPTNRVYLVNVRADPGRGVPVHGVQTFVRATFEVAPEATRQTVARARQQGRSHGTPGTVRAARAARWLWEQQYAPLPSALRSYWARFRPQ